LGIEGGLCENRYAHTNECGADSRWLPRNIFIVSPTTPTKFREDISVCPRINDFLEKNVCELTKALFCFCLRFSNCRNIQRRRIGDDALAVLEKLYLKIHRISFFHMIKFYTKACAGASGLPIAAYPSLITRFSYSPIHH